MYLDRNNEDDLKIINLMKQDNVNDISIETALFWASKNGHLNVVKYLESKGADIRADDDYAIRWASHNGHLNVVKYLESKSANIRAENDEAIRRASLNGHLDVVKFLESKGADIRADNDCAIRWASFNDHLEVVKFLESKGADIRAYDDYAINWASFGGHLEVTAHLLSRGADITKIDKTKSDKIIKYLYENGNFDCAIKLLNYFGCENEKIRKSLSKIQYNRNNFIVNIRNNYTDIVICTKN